MTPVTEIGALKFRALNNVEVMALRTDANEIFKSFDLNALGIKEAVDAFNAHWDLMEPFFALEQGSLLTEVLSNLDAERDDDLKGIKIIAQGYQKHRDDAKQQAAERILAAIETYGKNIPEQNIVAETESIFQLVKDFETIPGLMADLTLLHLDEWVAPLKATNKEFSEKYAERVKEMGDKPEGNFKTSRNAGLAVYYNMITTISATLIVTKNPELKKLIGRLNELIDKYNQLVAIRKANNARKKKKDSGN